jgi:hypothetical protein
MLNLGFDMETIRTDIFETQKRALQVGIQQCILHKDLGTHGENQCGTSGAHNMSIASDNGHNISTFLC